LALPTISVQPGLAISSASFYAVDRIIGRGGIIGLLQLHPPLGENASANGSTALSDEKLHT
jgi:hypothetical protein